MSREVKNLTDWIFQGWGTFSLHQRRAFIGTGILALMVLGVITSWRLQPEYVPIISQATKDQLTWAVEKLREERVPFRMSDRGQTLEVPKEVLPAAHRALITDLAGAVKGAERQSAMSSDILEVKKRWEKEFEGRLESLLSRVVGVGKAVVRVNATLNTKDISTLEEIVDPDSVVVKEQTAKAFPNGEKTREGQVTTTHNDLSRTTREIREAAGALARLSVAVLVDGSTRTSKEGLVEWVPRPPEEIVQLENLIKNAIGFTELRGDSVKVENIRFESTSSALKPPSVSLASEPLSLFKWLLLALGLVVLFFVLARSLIYGILSPSPESLGGVLPRTIEELEKLQSEGELSSDKDRSTVAMSPDKVESDFLKDQILDRLKQDEAKAVGALSIWLEGRR